MRRKPVVGMVVASVAISACSTYTPITLQLAPDAGTVRVALTDDARAQNFGALGSQIESIEGRVRAVSDSGVTISASEVSRADADPDRYRGETALIPSRYVVSVSKKRTQVVRSVLLAGAITGGLIWIGTSLGGGSVAYGRGTTPQPGQE